MPPWPLVAAAASTSLPPTRRHLATAEVATTLGQNMGQGQEDAEGRPAFGGSRSIIISN